MISLLIREDRKELISISSDDNNLLVWNEENGNLLSKLEGHTSSPLKIFFSRKSNFRFTALLSFSMNEIIVWNYEKAVV